MQSRHLDRRQYYEEQATTTRNYVIPFIEEVKNISTHARVLEVGCGEGGNMLPFAEMGCEVVGVDINESQLKRAKAYLDQDGFGSIKLLHEDIYNVTIVQIGLFDVIFLRDVIEHIPNQEKFILYIKSFLKQDGILFFGFPPWQMPFGGHQQVMKGWVSKLPYIHLLPRSLYTSILKIGGVPPQVILSRMDIRNTGINIERLEQCVKRAHMIVLRRTHYFTNPNYKTKFGLPIVRVKPSRKMLQPII